MIVVAMFILELETKKGSSYLIMANISCQFLRVLLLSLSTTQSCNMGEESYFTLYFIVQSKCTRGIHQWVLYLGCWFFYFLFLKKIYTNEYYLNTFITFNKIHRLKKKKVYRPSRSFRVHTEFRKRSHFKESCDVARPFILIQILVTDSTGRIRDLYVLEIIRISMDIIGLIFSNITMMDRFIFINKPS